MIERRNQPADVQDVEYVLHLTPQQAQTLSMITETFARIMFGQFGEISYQIALSKLESGDKDWNGREIMDQILLAARQVAYPDLHPTFGSYYGVGHVKEADRSWDFHQVLRSAIAWHEHPEGGVGADFSPIMSFCGEALPVCKVIKK